MIGRPHVHHRVTDSTNERAKELAVRGAPHGTLVTADEQTAGRGRQGRSWVAPPGRALLMSLVLRELDESHALLPLAAAVAVCEACEASADVVCSIKWPNDVWIEGRKVAGILVEGRPQEGWAVLGVGLNVATGAEEFPAELRSSATSLLASARATPPVADVCAELVARLGAWIVEPPSRVLEAWRERDALRGSAVRWSGGEGEALGISDGGALRVRTADGEVALDAGEVHLAGER
jgi:BirA family transcriptional regulator, biotin operon repressor / biotin---[acetyl-CoA-carboxylase] ligase